MAPVVAPRRHVRHGRSLLVAIAAAGFVLWGGFPSSHSFILCGGGRCSPRLLGGRTAMQVSTDYPDLSRVETLIYDSCMLKEGELSIDCLRAWDKLHKFHQSAKLECNLDDFRCIVLDVLDRLCKSIDGQEGLVLLQKVSSVVLSFRAKFTDWDAAFAATDADKSGFISLEELTEMLKTLNSGMTESEIAAVFLAADANGDGMVSKEEFSNFLTAAVFAEEPLRELIPDKLPLKFNFEDYLRWSMQGRDSVSWAALR